MEQRRAAKDEGKIYRKFILTLSAIQVVSLAGIIFFASIGDWALIRAALAAGGPSTLAAMPSYATAFRANSLGLFIGAVASFGVTIAVAASFYGGLRRRLDAASKRLETGASLDELTGLPNRRSMLERLEAELVRAKRTGSKFSCAIADIDDLTKINDEFGHADGDSVLVQAGTVLKERLRSYDAVGRYSGEQFLLILPGGGTKEGLQACERLRAAVEKQVGERVGLDYVKVTASFGVAALEEGDESGDALIRRADLALGRAKEAGKNRCSD